MANQRAALQPAAPQGNKRGSRSTGPKVHKAGNDLKNVVTTWQIDVKREADGYWVVTSRSPVLRGLITQGRTVREAQDMARNAIAILLDVSEASFAIDPVYRIGRSTKVVGKTREARSKARAYKAQADTVTRDAIRRMTDDGLTVRDIATMLGLSHQRIQQLKEA